jgi:hypothetical protein
VPAELSDVIHQALYAFDIFLFLHLFASRLILCDLVKKAWHHSC